MGCPPTTHRIPLDVILEILILLPAKSAVCCKCVCKEWCNLINDPLFAKLHMNKSRQPNSKQNQSLFCTCSFRVVDDIYRPSRWTKLNWPKDIITARAYPIVVGYCNGLVCFQHSVLNDRTLTVWGFLICNPTTRVFKLIFPSSEKIWKDGNLLYGFGYDSDHDDYKIIVTRYIWTESDRDVRIYSVKADLWSCPTPTPPTRVSSGRRWHNQQNVIFKDRMLHYLASANIVGDGRSQIFRDYRTARFDVVTERWREDLSLPQQKDQVQLVEHLQLGELDGLLYLRAGSNSTEFWILEEDVSWKMMFHLPAKFGNHQLIARSKDGHHRLLFQYGRDVKWYDYQDSTTVPFTLKPPSSYSFFVFCIASLVTIPGYSCQKLTAKGHHLHSKGLSKNTRSVFQKILACVHSTV